MSAVLSFPSLAGALGPAAPDPAPPTAAECAALRNAIERARAISVRPGRAPGIVAAVLARDEVLAYGENEVHAQCDPTRHAEVVAIARATRALGRTDLRGATLLSTLQPCEMCLAAMRFAGIGRLVFAARQECVHRKYFRFPALRITDFHEASGAAFVHHGGVFEGEVLDLYADGDE